MRETCDIYIIDDDRMLGDSLRFLLHTLKLEVRYFSSGDEFLEALERLNPGCVILDVHMPGSDGLKVQRTLSERGLDWPVIFMSGQPAIPSVVQAMKSGAVEFIEKPFRDEQLLEALHQGFRRLRSQGEADAATPLNGSLNRIEN